MLLLTLLPNVLRKHDHSVLAAAVWRYWTRTRWGCVQPLGLQRLESWKQDGENSSEPVLSKSRFPHYCHSLWMLCDGCYLQTQSYWNQLWWMFHPIVLLGENGLCCVYLNRWALAAPLFTPPCSTPAAYDGIHVASSEEARCPDLLDSGRICLCGGGHGPRSAHAQAPAAAPPGIKSPGS